MSAPDLYADEMAPLVEPWAKVYTVRVPGHLNTHWARVSVDQYEAVNLDDWCWGEQRHLGRPYRLSEDADRAAWQASREVYEWLVEWELIELKPIGPEDSEYFATDKLAAKAWA